MLVVKVEIWPYGDQLKARTLGTAKIANDGSGDECTGNYNVVLSNAVRVWKRGRVEGFPRKRLNAWDLLCRALANLLADRNLAVSAK